jgi:hypothetical protein
LVVKSFTSSPLSAAASDPPLGYLERLVHLTPRGAAAGATVERVEQEWAELIGTKDINQLRKLLRRLTTARGTTEL